MAAKPQGDPMPQSPEAERAVLGAILGDPAALVVVADKVKLRPPDFRQMEHAAIYACMLELHKANTPAELLLVCDALENAGKVEEAGTLSYVSELATFGMTYVQDLSSVIHYARIVKRKARARQKMLLSQRLASVAEDDEASSKVVAALVASDLIEDAEPRYKLLSVQDILNQPRPEPLIDHIFSLNSTGILYGPSGAGKSVLLLDQMVCVALSQPWEGYATTGGHVVYVCAEGQAYLGERLQAVMLKYHVQDLPWLHIIQVPTQLLEPSTVQDLLASLAAKLDTHPVWLVFETLSQTSVGANENDPSAMRDYTGAMGRLREATGALVMAVHHTGKNEELGARGASSLKGNVDTLVEVANLNGEAEAQDIGVVIMHCEKQRGGWVPFPDFSFRVESMAFDDYATRTGPFLRAVCEPTAGVPERVKRTRKVGMPDSWRNVLAALVTFPDYAASYSEWEQAAAQSYATTHGAFQRAIDHHLHQEYVSHNDSFYVLTTKGIQELPRNATTNYHEVPRNA